MNALQSPDVFEERQFTGSWITVQRADTWNRRRDDDPESKRAKKYKSNTAWQLAWH